MGFHVRYIDTVIESNEPVLINRGRHGAVLVSLDEYNALARTASEGQAASSGTAGRVTD
jgi:PHD/YefM family antitoxin component YafN of YafNO toxin-antitoxin module